MSNELISSSLTVSFTEAESSSNSPKLEQRSHVIGWAGTRDKSGASVLIVWCFPPDVDWLGASVGRVVQMEERVLPVITQVTFSDSIEASLDYPASNVIIELGLMLEKQVLNGVTTIEKAMPVLSFDDKKNVIISDKPVYGSARIRYDAPYRVLYYYPDILTTPFSDGSVAMSAQVGSIYATLGDQLTTLKLTVNFDAEDQTGEVELARVWSAVVLDSKGAHECPWVDGSPPKRFPDSSVDPNQYGDDLDPDNAMVYERVHALLFVKRTGIVRVQTFQPRTYFGYHTALFTIRFNSAPTGRGADWATVFSRARKNFTVSDLSTLLPQNAIVIVE